MAQTPPDPDELLAEIREKARANLTRLPDYICIETVEREFRPRPTEAFEPLDTIRLEVGLAGNQELFAWPGSSRLDESDVAELVNHGTIGNGAFGLHARNVFLSDGPDFEFRGEETLGARRAYRYDFDVPANRSSYTLRVRPYEARVAFHGSFWVDRDTLDLIRLQVDADEIPDELGLAVSSQTMEYQRVTIGTGEFLLPAGAEMSMLGIKGDATRNHTSFSNCRQYVGEASISFGRGSPDAPAAGGAPAEPGLELPPGTELQLALDTPIDTRNAVIGDPVQAVLTRPIREGRDVVVPQGAVVKGRLVRLERYDNPVEHYIVGLEFQSVEFERTQVSFTATMKNAGPNSSLIKQSRRLAPTFDRRANKASMQILVNEVRKGQGILHWKANKPVIEKGLKMEWEVER